MLENKAFAFGLILFLFFSMLGCYFDDEEKKNIRLLIVPGSVLPGMNISVHVKASLQDFNKCEKINEAREDDKNLSDIFIFETDEIAEKENFKVSVFDIVSENTLILGLEISEKARPGTVLLRLNCDDTSYYEGEFTVIEPSLVQEIIISPASLPAGTDNYKIKIEQKDKGLNHPFLQGVTRLFFGKGSEFLVQDISVDEDGTSLKCTVSVSDIALGPFEKSKTIQVAAVTGPYVAVGEFEITSSKTPSITVQPLKVKRPLTGELPQKYTLNIYSSNIGFPVSEENAVRIIVPNNPGITLGNINILSETLLSIDIEVEDDAPLGLTPVKVILGENEVVSTGGLVVLPEAQDSSVRFFPSSIPACVFRNCEPELVIAEAVNFNFSNSWSVISENSNVVIESFQLLSSSTMALYLNVKENSSAKFSKIVFSNGNSTFKSYILVHDEAGHRLRPVLDHHQGQTAHLILLLQQGLMRIASSAWTSGRSGSWIVSQDNHDDNSATREKKGIFIDEFRVLEDAPTGPALIGISGDGENLRSYYRISPAGNSPYITLSPDILWTRSPTSAISIVGNENMEINDNTQFEVSNSSFEILSYQTHELENRAVVDLAHSSGVREGIEIFYISNQGKKAAASVRVKAPQEYRIRGMSNNVFFRSSQAGVLSFPLIEGFLPEDLVANVFNGIGLKIERVYVSIDRRIKIVLSFEEAGPGGWVGILLKSGHRETIVPIYIDSDANIEGDDETLNATLTPSFVSPGSFNFSVRAQLPDVLIEKDPSITFNEHLLDVFSFMNEVVVYPENVVGQAGQAMDMRVNISHLSDNNQQYGGIPIAISTGEGAVIGILEITDDLAPQKSSLLVGNAWSPPRYNVFTDLLINLDFPESVMGVRQLILTRTSRDSIDYNILDLKQVSLDGMSFSNWTQNGIMWSFENFAYNLLGSFMGDTFVSTKIIGHDNMQTETQDLCNDTLMYVGRFSRAFEHVNIPIDKRSNCNLVAVSIARSLTEHAWATPDLRMSLCNGDVCAEGITYDELENRTDPRIYFDYENTEDVLKVDAQIGSIGYFIINVRGPNIIRRVSTKEDNRFAELEIDENFDFDNCSLIKRNTQNGEIEEELSLADFSDEIINGRVLRIQNSFMDNFEIQQSFVLELVCNDIRIDSLQVGGNCSLDNNELLCAEGEPVAMGGFDCFTRIGGLLDTNRNSFDFIAGWNCED